MALGKTFAVKSQDLEIYKKFLATASRTGWVYLNWIRPLNEENVKKGGFIRFTDEGLNDQGTVRAKGITACALSDEDVSVVVFNLDSAEGYESALRHITVGLKDQ